MKKHDLLSTALVILLGAAGLVTALAVEPQRAITKGQLKSAIKNAKTAEQHQSIAAYYNEQGDRLLAEAKEHDELAVVYAKSPNPHAVKHPMSGATAEHCKYFAEATRKAAKESKELAKLHDDMAKQVQ